MIRSAAICFLFTASLFAQEDSTKWVQYGRIGAVTVDSTKTVALVFLG